MVVPLSSIPPSRNGFYAINNQFLANGPKGFSEFKMLENEDMFIRIDLPGVPENGVRVTVDPTKKAVSVMADAPKEHRYDSSPRNYGSCTGLVCTCCQISAVASHMSDGVLRLLVSKTRAKTQSPSCIDPALTGRVLQPHPCVNLGSAMAYESKRLSNGSLYVRVDMPGVPSDRFTVSAENGRVMVTGEAPAVSHDSGGRYYSGDVAILSGATSIPIRKIKAIAKNGVIRLIIPPV
ncbi:unnamed protein product [Microthlaspi erraticum]|uniref:SHSP domain-containing protein n=1 Tax=Microthlaspi erraticum TaxID=1685480 RepID=A0A6D2JWQ2_9BRAS|nr:unnamed protein product [Microthlaspi erraticum]